MAHHSLRTNASLITRHHKRGQYSDPVILPSQLNNDSMSLIPEYQDDFKFPAVQTFALEMPYIVSEFEVTTDQAI